MKIDLTLPITPEMLEQAKRLGNKSLEGHLGTHFDVMDAEFPLEYTERRGVVIDVSHITDRDIDITDIDLKLIRAGDFVAFRTGFPDGEEYGTRRYYKEHPCLSHELIQALVGQKVSVIGVDCAGIRRGEEHIPTDAYCAERGVFVIENLRNLEIPAGIEGEIVIHTYPMRCEGITGLPCRVIADITIQN